MLAKNIPNMNGSSRSCKQQSLIITIAIAAFSLLLLIGFGSNNAFAAPSDDNNNAGKHPVFFSEYKLRNTIEHLNNELRQSKRDFTQEMKGTYFRMKSDPEIGFQSAKTGSSISVALTLIGEQFADISIKKHIIHRRLLAGLKVAYVKFLPIRTLQKLVEKFPSFSWLKTQNQVDLRPRFPEAKENQFVQLYSLIELRAKMRAADDIVTLTTDNIKRVLQTIQYYIIDKQQQQSDGSKLDRLARHGSKVVDFYLNLLESQKNLQKGYEFQLSRSKALADQIVGGKDEFLKFVDQIIDGEALDIDLNQEANELDLPPTINSAMINNVASKWIPRQVLESINEDQRLLINFKRMLKPLVGVQVDDRDIADWCARVSYYICQKAPFY